jgi:8-oxo-dGTP diphosphatase
LVFLGRVYNLFCQTGMLQLRRQMATNFDNYFKSAFTVDNVIFGFDEGDLKVLLIKRGEEPHLGEWALPGYFVKTDEDLDSAAQRVLSELTGLSKVYLEQVHTFGSVNRHAFGRVITISYFSLIKIANYTIQPSSIALQTQWHTVNDLQLYAFDHGTILAACLQRLKWLVKTRPVGFELLPPKFTLTELQHLYEAILRCPLDKRNFRKKILSMNLLVDCDETQEGVAHRPAKLYKFDRKRYNRLVEQGFNFELKETPIKKKVQEASL